MELLRMDADKLKQLLPKRDRYAHKGDFGRGIVLLDGIGDGNGGVDMPPCTAAGHENSHDVRPFGG